METNNENIQTTTNEQINSDVENSFFYTIDKFLQNLDITELISNLVEHYPGLEIHNKDTEIKKTFLEMFKNEEYIIMILDMYHMTIYDLIKSLYVTYGSLFKGAFLKKIKNEINNHSYGKIIKPKSAIY